MDFDLQIERRSVKGVTFSFWDGVWSVWVKSTPIFRKRLVIEYSIGKNLKRRKEFQTPTFTS